MYKIRQILNILNKIHSKINLSLNQLREQSKRCVFIYFGPDEGVAQMIDVFTFDMSKAFEFLSNFNSKEI
jgi:hypothetical protein